MAAFRLQRLGRILRAGGLVAYPTEAVYGLGCDPLNDDAVQRLLALKGRAAEKGLILIAADIRQIRPFLGPIEPKQEAHMRSCWPGPVTWLVPSSAAVPPWLNGGRDTIAVRVTAHRAAADLCRAFGGALVSTSANRSGGRPARSALRARVLFGNALDGVLHGPTGGRVRPSEIRDLSTGAVVRAG